ncbi:MAG: undecaprenyldiphospho-muramoylpentapeptide beta-N-acetylglucosaminyltransferase [Clostridia bacterium]|nr:undecaprenyldiphospho-muramoylpentapeptide beta-N-acetylglucosaminyltransferase [Clostridia bacterium]
MRLLVTGGGTGGHIYPAIAVAQRVRQRHPSASVLYVGTPDGMEARLAVQAGLPFAAVEAGGLVGKRPREAWRGLRRVVRGVVQAMGLVRAFRPDAVLGTGGYAAVPVAVAAILQRVPVVLQEQNAVPGVANRLLARRADLILVAYEEARRAFPRPDRVLVTGNPVRPEVLAADRDEARRRLGLAPEDRLVLIFMGSRGSATVNRCVVEALPLLISSAAVLFATGRDHFGAVRHQFDQLRISLENIGKLWLVPYLDDMASALAAADLVVCRAGAVTLAEVTARGLPAVLIPSPHVTHGHQLANAHALAAAGAATVLREEGLTGAVLAAAVRHLLADEQALTTMAANSRAMGRPEALDAVVDAIFSLVRARSPHRRG